MFSPFICGAFHPEDDQDELGANGSSGGSSPSSTPKRSSGKKHSLSKTSHNKSNPYADRGLDKFEALRADLEEKKKKIYTQNDPADISFVRFAYNSSNDCVPIVVKLKDKSGRSPPRDETATRDKPASTLLPENPQQSATTLKPAKVNPKSDADRKLAEKKKKKKTGSLWDLLSMERWRRPSYYVPAAIILIMVFLVFFGRSVAIMCTSIGWYMIPMLTGDGLAGEKVAKSSGKKKMLSRRSSENKIVVTMRSPNRSPEQHGHRRSG